MAAAPDLGLAESAQALEVVTAVVRLLRDAAAGPPTGADGLSLTEIRLLKRLVERVSRACDLAAELDVTPATVSAAVDALARRGFVQRQDPGGDRRAVPLSATAEGAAALAAARERQHRALGALMSGLRADERRALAAALAGLARLLDGMRVP